MATKKKSAASGKKTSAAPGKKGTAKRKSSRAAGKSASAKKGPGKSAASRTSAKRSTGKGKASSSKAKRTSSARSSSNTSSAAGAAFIARLKKAAGDLERFQDELAKGKTVAQQKYEELKKDLNEQILAAQKKFKTGDGKKFGGLHTDLGKLQEQLAHGKAETLEAFNDQKKRIFSAVNRLDDQLPGAPFTDEIREKLHDEMEKFRIKMDLLRSYYDMGKKTVATTIEEKKHDLEDVLAKVRERYDTTRKAITRTQATRQRELKEAYKHLRKAFVPA